MKGAGPSGLLYSCTQLDFSDGRHGMAGIMLMHMTENSYAAACCLLP